MSIKIKKIRNYIKETYQRFGEIYYAYYWNLGYLSCLFDEKKITTIEHTGLSGYCDRLHFVEQMKITNRKVQIEKEESKDMELEQIKKRIDENLCKGFIIESADMLTETQISEIRRLLENYHEKYLKALKIYKELIVKVQRMNILSDKRELQVDTNYQITEHIKYLEEKYYPKPKTFRQKIADIVRGDWGGSIAMMRGKLREALKDEIPDQSAQNHEYFDDSEVS